MSMDTDKEILNILADNAHRGWSEWMIYQESLCVDMGNTNYSFPIEGGGDCTNREIHFKDEDYTRWLNQMNTPFEDLTSQEQKSDYEQAWKLLDLLSKHEFEIGREFTPLHMNVARNHLLQLLRGTTNLDDVRIFELIDEIQEKFRR